MTTLLAIAIFFCVVFAAGCTPAPTALSPTGADTVLAPGPHFIQYLADSFNGVEGASILASAGLLIQALLRSLDNPIVQRFLAARKISRTTLIASLTFLITPIGLISGAGLSVGAALVHSSTLLAFIVFLNQAAAEYSEMHRLP